MLSVAIVTRNAVHGGVETMIATHQSILKADVFVAGEINSPGVCPFTYTYIDATDETKATQRLREALNAYDVTIYHWLPTWALEAVRGSGRPSIEFVHRTDTSDNDKTIPTLLITHSEYLARFLFRQYSRQALVIPHSIDVSRFKPSNSGLATARYIGGLTSYLLSKGVDNLLRAWYFIYDQFPEQRVRFYGGGPDLDALQELAKELQIPRVEFCPPAIHPEEVLPTFKLFVHPARVEGLPFTILEALACNVPVIATNFDAMVELNAQATSSGYPEPVYLVRNGDMKGLSECIARFLRGEIRMPETRPFVEEHFTLERLSRMLWQAIFTALQVYQPKSIVPIAPFLP